MKSKYETHIVPNISNIRRWVKAGATVKEVAGKLGIAYSSLRKYIDLGDKGDARYAAFAAMFAEACQEPDDKVEAALFKKATGIMIEESKTEEVIDKKTGEKKKLTTKTKRYIPPDTQAAMFWLSNRRKDRWSYRPEGGKVEAEGTGVVVIPGVAKDG